MDDEIFRVSLLRRVSVTAPYADCGEVWDLKAAVQTMAEFQLGEELGDA